MTSTSVLTAEECRRKADEAEEAAQACKDVQAKRVFKLVAEEWRELAKLRDG